MLSQPSANDIIPLLNELCEADIDRQARSHHTVEGARVKAVLVRPPVYCRALKYPSGPRFGLPISLLYLAAYLEHLGVSVAIYDGLIDFDWKDVKADSQGRYHIGVSWGAMADRVQDYRPDVVGITNPFCDMAEYAIRAAEEIKAARPDVVTVIGGPHATSCPEEFLSEKGSVDYVVRGEGEKALADLVNALSNGGDPRRVPSISYMDHGQVCSNPRGPFIKRLDDLPLPAYHLVPIEKYFDYVKGGYPSRFTFEYPGSEREVSIITSRGCPFHCVFCGNHLLMGRVWRHHSVRYVLTHMELLVRTYGVRHFHIEDDNLGLDTGRLRDLLDGIISKGWDITWDTPNGVRAHGWDREVLSRSRASGCTYLEFGIESGRQETLDKIIKKGIRLDELERVLSICEHSKIDIHAFYVVGFPGETHADIDETFKFAKRVLWRYGVIPHLYMARPLRGTELHEICEKNGYLTRRLLPDMGSRFRSEVFPRVMIRTEHFGPEDLEKWIGHFNRQVIAIVLLKTVVWLICHPRVIPAVFRKFLCDRRRGLKEATKRAFYGGLFFKFNYLNKRLRSKYGVLPSLPSNRHG